MSCASDTAGAGIEVVESACLAANDALIERGRYAFMSKEFQHERWHDKYRIGNVKCVKTAA